MLNSLLRFALGLLRGLATGVLALVIVFEEWGWEPLQRLLARLGQWPVLRQLEAAIAGLPPRAALVVFLLPSLLLVPIKLAALGLIAHGQHLAGLLVIVVAKLLGTAVLARLFTLTHPALMQLPWFARWYGRWVPWKATLLARVRASWVWRATRLLKRALLRRWSRL